MDWPGTTILLLSTVVVSFGCTPTMESQPDVPAKAAAVASAAPRHERVEVFINNHRFGEANGCTTTFTPEQVTSGPVSTQEMRCGHPGAESRLSWCFLHSDEDGDHYRFERVFPHGEPHQEVTRRVVTFTGDEIVLFEDETQRICMRLPSQR
jgi:hypothetical protein